MKVIPAQGGFFDIKKILAATNRKTRAVLMRFGAFTRQRSRSSIRKRKKVSAPGTPPSGHVGTLRAFIKFDVDMQRQSVIIGPERLSGKIGQAPSSLEHGGESETEMIVRGTKERKEIIVRERPFMGPAFEAEKKASLPRLWQDVPFK